MLYIYIPIITYTQGYGQYLMLLAIQRPASREFKVPISDGHLLPLLSAYQILCQRAVWGQHSHDHLFLHNP